MLAESLPVPLTVSVYAPGVVPGIVVPVVELLLPPPKATNPPSAAIASTTTIIESHFRRLTGSPINTRAASIAPPLAPPHGKLRFEPGIDRSAVVGAVVFTVTVDVPLVVPAPNVTVCPAKQVGRFEAFAGLEVTLQDSVTVPA